MKRLFSVCFLTVALFAGTLAHGQGTASPPAGNLQARISDTLGAAISRAFVIVHSDLWGDTTQKIPVDEDGAFHVQLAPGLYDLFISSPGFVPFAKEIKIETGKSIALKIKLKVDMEHLDMTSQAGK